MGFTAKGQSTFLYGASHDANDDTEEGHIFRTDSNGNNLEIIDNFQSEKDGNGESTYQKFIEVNGVIYGTTIRGGNYNKGTLFSYTISTKTHKVLHHFNSGAIGYHPGQLTLTDDGNLIGACPYGGSKNLGTLFKHTVATSKTETLADFTHKDVQGSNPQSNLFVSGTIIYGTCFSGGKNEGGTLFFYSLTSKNLAPIFYFQSATSGKNPSGLTHTSNGTLIGTTSNSGQYGNGSIFEYSYNTNQIAILHHYNFARPSGRTPLMEIENGVFVGTSFSGPNYKGYMYEYSRTGDSTRVIFDFNSNQMQFPQGNIVAMGNGEYIMPVSGGYMTNGFKGGLVKYTRSTDKVTELVGTASDIVGNGLGGDLHKSPTNGRYYFIANGGGNGGLGGLMEYDPIKDTILNIKSFGVAPKGKYPVGGLIKLANNKLIGATTNGGEGNNGVIYQIDPQVGKIEVLAHFNSIQGKGVTRHLTLGEDGNVYGVNPYTYSNYIFKFNTTTNQLSNITNTNRFGIRVPESLTAGPNGKFYGIFKTGGDNNLGGLFLFDLADSSMKILKSFVSSSSTTGINCQTKLLLASNGLLYGTSSSNGANNLGNIFQYDPALDSVTVLQSFVASNGKRPLGSLIQAKNGKLYGVAGSGNIDGSAVTAGAIYEYDISSNSIKGLASLAHWTTGGPTGVGTHLTEMPNGKLFGITNRCRVFEFDINTSTLSPKAQGSGLLESALTSVLVQKNNSSVVDTKNTKVVVFPNPTSSSLNIETDKRINSIKVYSLQGKLLLEQVGSTTTIDVAELPVGIYTLQVEYNNTMGYAKFIKN